MWRVLTPDGKAREYTKLETAKDICRKYEGAIIQERCGNYDFTRYYTRSGRVLKN